MLELNNWFFVQLINFLVLLYVLNIILFRPVLRVLKERDERIGGFLEKAKEMDKEKEFVLKELNAKLAQTRDEAKQIHDDLRSKGLEAQRQGLETAASEAEKMIGEAREKLKAEAEKARAALKGDIEAFSKKIVEKMVGV